MLLLGKDRSTRASYALGVLTCPSCGQQNPDGARFCNACASPLETDERALGEERKTVTVVFVDLVGFTAQAERLDPEDVRGVLSPYHARMRAELERRGGTVEKFIGDAVMAVFGAPVAHEDDPERAVRAALAIRDWSAEQEHLQVRVAVNTGEALVDVGARSAEGEAMVAGDVVNTAARMQAAAPVDGVLVGETTYWATRDAIRYREAAAVQAKGKVEPVPGLGGSRGDRELRRRRRRARDAAGGTRARARLSALDSRARARGAFGPARHARRRPRNRQVATRRRAPPDCRRRA